MKQSSPKEIPISLTPTVLKDILSKTDLRIVLVLLLVSIVELTISLKEPPK